MFFLRPYQTESIELLRRGFKDGHKRQVLCQPTGAGKSVVFSYMIYEASRRNKKILCLTDRIELFNQNLAHIGRVGISPQIITANTKQISNTAQVSLAMVETLKRRLKNEKLTNYNPDLLVVDECHRANFLPILNLFPNALTVGCSATPIHKELGRYYSKIVANVSVLDLIKQGYLCRARSFQMQDNDMDFSNVKIKGGEFEEKSLFNLYDKKKLYDGVVNKYLEKTPNKKSLVFCVNIAHSEKMNDEFNLAGIKSFCITSKTHIEERKRILSDFSDGKFNVLVNCGCLTTGVDIPSVEVIIFSRATLSTALFLQCIGRGSRPTETKKEFTILDFGMNFTRHGLYDTERKWSLEPPKKKKKGIMPIRACPQCGAMLHANANTCEFCGYIFPKKEAIQKNGVLIEIKQSAFIGRKISELSIHELVQLSKFKIVKINYIWRIIRSKGMESLKLYSQLMGYKNGWVYNQGKKLLDCKFNDKTL